MIENNGVVPKFAIDYHETPCATTEYPPYRNRGWLKPYIAECRCPEVPNLSYMLDILTRFESAKPRLGR